MADGLFSLRQASEVFSWPSRPGPRWRPPRCAACRLPISRESQVIDVARLGWCHPFCAGEINGDDEDR